MTSVAPYVVRAFNTATASENKIHSDDVATEYGFAGGLVPGVDVYAYLTHAPAAAWGLDWLRGGSMAARFAHPVYDGDEVSITSSGDERSMTVELHDSKGQRCAAGAAALPGGPEAAGGDRWADIEAVLLPEVRPPASPADLAKGTVLGPFSAGFHAAQAGAYLDDVRETLGLYRAEGVAHPGWLLRFSNWVLTANVTLGAWIHVGSDVRFLDLVRDGERVEARARVTDEYERSGHRFVVLDVGVTADERPVQRVVHTAIYQPRRGPKG